MTVHLIDLRSDVLRYFTTFSFFYFNNNNNNNKNMCGVWMIRKEKFHFMHLFWIIKLFVLYCTQGIATHHRQFSPFSQPGRIGLCSRWCPQIHSPVPGEERHPLFFFFLHTSSLLLDKPLGSTEVTGVTLLLPGSNCLEPTPCFCPPFYLCQLF